MLAPLLAIAIVTSGLPAPAAGPGPLTEIGRVRAATPYCSGLVVHANSAIGSALKNDQTMGLTLKTLRRVNLDLENGGDELQRRNGLAELEKLSVSLRQTGGYGTGEVKRLRDMAKDAPDQAQRTELNAFADSLGGALHRQSMLGAELASFITVVESRINRASLDKLPLVYLPASRYEETGIPWAMRNEARAGYTLLSRRAADDFEQRLPSITEDEAKAAEHVLGSLGNC